MLLYQKIHDHINNLISSDPKLNKLPSERQLQELFKSTRITVREALIRLEAEGTIYRLNRKGWFVNTTRLHWDPIKKANYYELAREQGYEPKTQLLKANVLTGDDHIRQAFAMAQGEQLNRIARVRMLDGRAVLYEVIYCCVNDFPDLINQQLGGSLTAIFTQRYNVDVKYEQSKIFMSVLAKEEAAALEQNEGAPCLKIVRKRFNQDDVLMDYNIEFWVNGAIELQVTSQVT